MVYAEPMARAVVEPAVRKLMQRCSGGEEPSTTVEFRGDGFNMCAHVRVHLTAPGQVKVALACWVVNMDMARYFGSTPPSDDETRLPQKVQRRGTRRVTHSRVIGQLATRMNALDAPQPNDDDHFTITVPLISP
jgi:hypothetical protein